MKEEKGRKCLIVFKFEKQYRLPHFDYSSPGYYFITICVKDRRNLLGSVSEGKMNLSEIGKIAQRFWMEIPARFANIRLDQWVIMPNHMHGIIEIGIGIGRNAPWRVRTMESGKSGQSRSKFEFKSGLRPLDKNSISSVINHFKGNVKRYCNQNGMEYFGWQPRFHDRIVRDERALETIRRYIRENPARWAKDRLARNATWRVHANKIIDPMESFKKRFDQG